MPPAITARKPSPSRDEPRPEPGMPVHTGEIIYPEVSVSQSWEGADGPLDAAACMELLGWYPEQKKGTFGENDWDLEDQDHTGRRKVRLVHNVNNRWHDESISLRYAYEILNGNWAGPTSFPGETVNGETVVITRTGKIKSGQHRLVGCVLAKQLWDRCHAEPDFAAEHPRWLERWETEPVLESLVVFGISDASEITRTVDNVRPRTGADTMFASGLFADEAKGDRKTLCKTLDATVKYLWQETAASDDAETPYRTQAEIEKFTRSHPTLEGTVLWYYRANRTLPDGTTALGQFASPGTGSGLLYMMRAGATDWEAYKKDRTEGAVDFRLKDKADEFWTGLSNTARFPSFEPVRLMLFPRACDSDKRGGDYKGKMTGLIFSDQRGTGPGLKQTALSKAWGVYRDGGDAALTRPNLELHYTIPPHGYCMELDEDGNETGREILDENGYDRVETCVIGGVQCPPKGETGAVAAPADPARKPTPEETFARLCTECPNHVLLFRMYETNPKTGVKTLKAARLFGQHVPVAEEVFGIERLPKMVGSLALAVIPPEDFGPSVEKLQAAGHKVASVECENVQDSSTWTVHPLVARGGDRRQTPRKEESVPAPTETPTAPPTVEAKPAVKKAPVVKKAVGAAAAPAKPAATAKPAAPKANGKPKTTKATP